MPDPTNFAQRAIRIRNEASDSSYPSPGHLRPSLVQYRKMCDLVVEMAEAIDKLTEVRHVP